MKTLILMAACLAFGALGPNWHECADGAIQKIQRNGKLDKNAPMLSIALDPSSDKTTPVKVRATIVDNTDDILSFVEPGVLAKDFEFEVKDDKGNVVAPNDKLQEARDTPNTAVGFRHLHPGDAAVYLIYLSAYYTFDANKKYTVKLSKHIGFGLTGSKGVEAQSNVLEVTATAATSSP